MAVTECDGEDLPVCWSREDPPVHRSSSLMAARSVESAASASSDYKKRRSDENAKSTKIMHNY